MQEIFENIIEKLEERIESNKKYLPTPLFRDTNNQIIGLKKAIEIVNQAAAEYNNGWIPVSESLPDYGESVLVSFNKAIQPLIATLYENDTWNMLQGVNGLVDITNDVIAWQPLPEPYQPKGETKCVF